MKASILKKQIVRNFAVAGVFALIFGSIYYFYSSEKNTIKGKIDAIDGETSKINVELADLQSKTAEIKKYKDLWSTISLSRKNTNGIKIDEINAKMNTIAAKYGVGSPTIKLSLPEAMSGGVFERKTVSVMMTGGGITFTAASDVKALMFVNEFISSLKGYPIVTAFSVSKSKDYDNDDLIQLSSGKSQGLVNGKVDFYWYVYKEKEAEKKAPVDAEVPNAQIQTP